MSNNKQNHLLSYSEIKPNMMVKDNKGNVGKVTDTEHDIHNVEVDYLQGGAGLYCLDDNCDKYDPLYIK